MIAVTPFAEQYPSFLPRNSANASHLHPIAESLRQSWTYERSVRA